jgi:molybdenum cofactor guanylyltransferase
VDKITNINPYLIAGGLSTRLGDLDKRNIVINGETLIQRSVRIIKEATGKSAVIVGDNLGEVAPSGYKTILDAKSGCGPLGGLVSAMKHSSTPFVLVTAVDMPALQVSDLKKLIESVDDNYDVVSLGINNRPETLATIYKTSLVEKASELLEKGEYALYNFQSSLSVKIIEPASGPDALKNINNITDLEGLE